jgi:protein tyrosine phosphatase (PTP) superfamily phosphohydrolase (DUF442 family)
MHLFSFIAPPLILILAILAGQSANSQKDQPRQQQPAPDGSSASAGQAPATPQRPLTRPVKIMDDERLPNVFQIHAKVFSGAQPNGDQGFQVLKDLGVKTIITVDAARPDVERAHKYGMKYVHLPHGYDGIPANRVHELAKAVRALGGPIYIHCHHGKHRSPAAAAVACVAAGLIPHQSALAVLEAAGTSKNYRGLYQSAADARKLDDKLLRALKVEFKEVTEVPPLPDAMAAIEHHHDHLNQIAKNNWRPLADHPDLAPAHEALLLREHFTEALRLDEVQQQPSAFRQLMQQAEQNAQALEDEYRAWESARPPAGRKKLDAALAAVTRNCAACHHQFRDVPLREKQLR